MDISLLSNQTTSGAGTEFNLSAPARGVEGANIMLWGTIGSATVTLQVKTPDDTWINTSVVFTTIGEKNILLKPGRTVRLNVTGAVATNVSAIITP